MWGISRNVGKRRSKLGEWLDRKGFTQEDLVKEAKISRNTASKVCNDARYIPSPTVTKKILKAVRKVDPDVKLDNFWII